MEEGSGPRRRDEGVCWVVTMISMMLMMVTWCMVSRRGRTVSGIIRHSQTF